MSKKPKTADRQRLTALAENCQPYAKALKLCIGCQFCALAVSNFDTFVQPDLKSRLPDKLLYQALILPSWLWELLRSLPRRYRFSHIGYAATAAFLVSTQQLAQKPNNSSKTK
mmetsp:Transcript_2482/g.4275  ORF Transcript_2482/g.4275 Transcript_2482/m.4275 type:complete len:113 (-) Transcript_2482:574-912(-)